MASRNASGPNDRNNDRGPRDDERFGRQVHQSDSANTLAEQARRIVADLVSNGAVLSFWTTNGLPTFTYELRDGGDRQRCRQIIAETKADPLLWAALLQEIARRSREAA